MYPLDVIHGKDPRVLRRWRAGVWGRIDHKSISVRGHRPAPGVRLVSVPPIQACCRHAWCLACVELLPPREGGLHSGLTHHVFDHAMAKQLPLS